MTPTGAEKLLRNLCDVPELVPDLWNIFEPIDKPFNPGDLAPVIYGSMVPPEKATNCIRTLAFFVRTTKPRYGLTIDLRLAPVQWGTAHNRILVRFEEAWAEGEKKLAQYLLSSVLPEFPDYVKIVESTQEDSNRLKEFRRSLSPSEFLESLQNRTVTAPFGPYGCLEDIYWFNYFGRVYVDFIGIERLSAAAWAHVEPKGGGLACYASSTIGDPFTRQQRANIASQLEEFIWTPGCKPESKRIPNFDFSAQAEALRK
ncbi:MAG TPA: hypothetical protein VGR14_21780 [Verrucomicrobiae bacterium]|jgi:hypothetical protein|nr:hypothetical protein [Verrucomicrobiae bacterium]